MDLINNIKNKINIKESLIELKSLTDEYDFESNQDLKDMLIDLLNNEDPKIRKNCALLLGQYKDTGVLLIEAYQKETTDYVKEAYLKGLSHQDCRMHIETLQHIQEELMKANGIDIKHIQAQLKILNPLILKNQVHKKKVLKLKHEEVDVVLTSLPYYQFVLFEKVLHLKYKPIKQGVLVRTNSVYDLLNIRSYKDMLIPLANASSMAMNEEAIVNGLRKCNIIEILDKLYDNHSITYFRMVDGLREKDTQLIKKVSQKLFELYPQRLLNTTDEYEIEVVLKEVIRGKVNAYIRLAHLKNNRFVYRKDTIATSMQGYVAATLNQLAKPYMIDDAKVLDPFVGTGTLLIERNILKPTHFAMGIDIFGKGIESARKNTKAAGQTIYYVNKDALRFVNNEMFDEIITDMPTFAQMNDREALENLYDKFFARIPKLVRPEGYVFLYTSEISLVRKNLRLQEGYLALEEHYEIPRGKNMFYFFIIKVR
ncbi:MAG: hypothetical protein RR630_04580 [Coprobacillus sp.]